MKKDWYYYFCIIGRIFFAVSGFLLFIGIFVTPGGIVLIFPSVTAFAGAYFLFEAKNE